MANRVKFTQDYQVKAKDGPSYKKDQVVEFPDDAAGRASVQHFTDRGVAVETDERAPARANAPAHAPAPAPEPPKKPEHGGDKK